MKLSGEKWSSHTTLLELLTKSLIFSLSFRKRSSHFLHKARFTFFGDFLRSGKKFFPFPGLFLQLIA